MKIFTGTVLAVRPKTAVVEMERIVTHPLYKKKLRRHRKYQVQDEVGVKVGDKVKFAASKPYSRTKRWRILK